MPNPSNRQFRAGDFWREARKDLHAAYRGICAYTCMFISENASIDHYLPKSSYPRQAYEWSNFRLATQRVNSNKGNSEAVIDPFKAQAGWFVMDIPSCLIRAADGLDEGLAAAVGTTINVLRLNDDDYFVQQRSDVMVLFAEGQLSLEHLDERYPFLAVEIRRHGIETTAGQIFKRPGP